MLEDAQPFPLPVILDCDPGLDDAIALALLTVSQEFELLGVTTAAGNVSLDQGTTNTGGLLNLLDLPSELPFHAGFAGPSGRFDRGPDEPIHGPDGIGEMALPSPRLPGDQHAVEWLYQQLLERKHQITIIAIAPLTNIAGLLHRYPDAGTLIREVIIMGGAAYCPGNVTPTAEFNFHADPEAARFVSESGVPIRIIPLDVTRQALMTRTEIDRLRARPGIAHWCGEMLDYLTRGFYRSHGVDACAVHDVVAVGAILWPELFGWESAAVTVECGGEFTRGTMIVDAKGRLGRESTAEVALHIDADQFRERLYSRLTADINHS